VNTPHTQREPWVDALRALALLGVFLVNGMGYAFAPNYSIQIGPPQPLDSSWALALHAFVITFVMGKAWPLLSFLFGYSLCSIALAARAKGLDDKLVLRKRYVKLLTLGVVHGVFLYFGDVLTTYAVGGLILFRIANSKASKLLSVWRKLTIILTSLFAVFTLVALVMFSTFEEKSTELAVGVVISPEINFADVPNWEAFFNLNWTNYALGSTVGMLIFLPLVAWLMIAGILARRFQLLSQHRFSIQFWAKYLRPWQLWIALSVNAGLAAVSCYQHMTYGLAASVSSTAAYDVLAGMWLAAAALACAMRYVHRAQATPRWALWLAPAGRHTLMMYLGLSACLVLTNGAFLNVSAGTVVTFVVLVVAWFLAVLVARAASAKGWRDSIARWLSK
jgi:uncharacterized protein